MNITEETRRESNQKVDRQTRYNKILSVLISGVEMTAREVMHALHYKEPNEVRPRMTELCQKGTLEVVPGKKKYEPETDRYVAVYKRKELNR